MPSLLRAGRGLARQLLSCLALVLVLLPSPALAQRPACTCENLESLQQEYRNAVYLEQFMRQMAEVLKTEELRLKGLKVSSNRSPDADLAIIPTVLALQERYVARNMKLPHPTLKDYTGPNEITMPAGTCEQPEAKLEAMQEGSACAAIAEATAAHERMHRDLCNVMGKEAYWDRMPSVRALEEAERYRAQAANMKSELGRVLEVSDVRLRGEWRHVIAGQGVEIVYFYQFESGDLTASSQAGDRWVFSGTGETQNMLESMKAPGLTCTSSGAYRNNFTVALDTDGLTYGLDYREELKASDITVTCNGGMGMAVPTTESSSGRLGSSLPLAAGDNVVPNAWADAIVALAASEGMSVTGEPKTVLSVTCPKP
jgi:hypothetical protein